MEQDRLNAPPSSSPGIPRRRPFLSGLSNLFALAASFLALALGVYQSRLMNAQTQLMQSQARGSVWPYLSIGYRLSNEGEKRGYIWEVSNDGVGPARIESVTMSLDGKPIRNWKEMFGPILGDVPVSATYSRIYGKVVPPSTNRETTIEAVRILDLEQARTFYAAQKRFDMAICYCSVYDECWIAHWQKPKVDPVERCETSNTVQFEQDM
ncbi:hypothetical protein [Dokdonella sp.]|uniref:hypothetical protein n=1 Tax=Dokdonella sp. TaxID=2291710 RepID=UPI001B2246AB|nr:hypothetical protein [Dokdonella sp.]MBO9662205.1 hypothetical protein [Dokdonella sp.]